MKNSPTPIKALGQNFLSCQRTQQKIINACALTQEDVVVEIGPGQGAITKEILPLVKKLIGIEKDGQLVSLLNEQFPQAEIIHGDFLKWDMSGLPDDLVVIGNIPYYISTPIIETIISNRKKIRKAFLTVQLEFAQRLVADSGNKDYGSLTCFVQYYFEVKILFKISKGSFNPVPKVDSCFVSLTPRRKRELNAYNEEKLFGLIQKAFMQRRKTIANALKGVAPQDKLLSELAALKISVQARPEDLTLSNYIMLSNALMI